MVNTYRIFRKELGAYFNSPQAYIFLVVFLLIGQALFLDIINGGFFKAGIAGMHGFFSFTPWLFLFLCPAIAMRIWSEEKRSGTQELLMTMPLRDWEVVLGKYFSTLFLLALALVFTFPLVYMIKHFAADSSQIDYAQIICGYLGAFLLGATALAVSCCASALTVNQIVAFIIASAVTFIMIIIGIPSIADSLPPVISNALANVSLMSHYTSLYRGVIDIKDVVYFLSVILLFLFINVRIIESRKWK